MVPVENKVPQFCLFFFRLQVGILDGFWNDVGTLSGMNYYRLGLSSIYRVTK